MSKMEPTFRAGAAVKLADLVRGLGELAGDGSVQVEDIAVDSRAVSRGALFVCRRGLTVDSHRFAADAVARGAAALVVEGESAVSGTGSVPVVRVQSSDVALAHLACRFYGHPSHEFTVIGVTGTNGKTTVTHLLASAFTAGGHRAAVAGTLGYGIPAAGLVATDFTTPPAPEFQRRLRSLAGQGVDVLATEVSSHALKSHRTLGTRFAAAVFTNLTRDHLDFHTDEEDYRASKLRLFERTARGDDRTLVAVVNDDDPAAEHFEAAARRSGDRLITASRLHPAQVWVRSSTLRPDGTELVIGHPRGETRARLRLPGDYNIDNALVAFATAIGLGVDPEAAARGLAAVVRVPGRLERVEHSDAECGEPGEGIEVLVDYAHTPDALETVLTTVRGIVRRRLIAVFGCGGDRDQGKRPMMAAVGTRLADLSILTTDNPRSEDPEAILAQMVSGVVDGADFEVVTDRRAAIQRAIELADRGDVVVIAGKGHETVQIVGDRRLPFDDREEARRALALRHVS